MVPPYLIAQAGPEGPAIKTEEKIISCQNGYTSLDVQGAEWMLTKQTESSNPALKLQKEIVTVTAPQRLDISLFRITDIHT